MPSATYPQSRAFAITGKEASAVINLPFQEPAPDEVRVKVSYVGICGSDLHYYFDGVNGGFEIKEPLIPGHEISGLIDSDPTGEFESGTPVAIFPAQPGRFVDGLEDRPHLWHGVRYMGSAATLPHTQGGMCDYIYVKRWMIKVLPSHLSLRAGALAEPLAVALHGIALAGEIRGKRILVSGSGPIGLLTIAAAKKRGVRSITATDLVPTALERARVLGADSLINVSEEKLPADSYDVIFECSGNPDAVNAALSAVERGGTIVQIGMISRIKPEISIGLVVTKELRFLGAFRFNEAIGEMDEAISFLATEPNCEKCISHTFPFEKVVEGFVTARDSALSGKVLIEF